PEPRALVHARVRAGQDHLQGRQPPEAELPRLVDDPHGAAAQLAEDFIARDQARRPARRRSLPPGHPAECAARPPPGRRAPVRVRDRLLEALEERRVELEPAGDRPGPGRGAGDQLIELPLAREALLDVRADVLLRAIVEPTGEELLQGRARGAV